MNCNNAILYFIILLTIIIISFIIYKPSRLFIMKIHSAKDDKYSWTRYIGSFIILFSIYIVLFQLYLGITINDSLALGLIGIVITGKITQRMTGERNIFSNSNKQGNDSER